MTELAIRQYTLSDQLDFAALSGDRNPLHVDPVAARRTMFGQPIVHGVHLVLWAIEQWASDATGKTVTEAQVRLLKPAFLDEKISLTIEQLADNSITLTCGTGSAKLCVIKMSIAAASDRKNTLLDWVPAAKAKQGDPKNLGFEELSGKTGKINLDTSLEDMVRFFPNAVKLLGAQGLASILALTRLVGMECPGLNSIFSSFDIEFTGKMGNQLTWEVTKSNPRMSLVNIVVDGGGIAGKLTVFFRPPPQAGLDYGAIAARVESKSSERRNALIIGGSRGLGRTTAILLAAGGADVVITYRNGKAEADALVQEIRSNAGTAQHVALDTSDPSAALETLAERGFLPDEIYYFATPHIFVRKKALFEQSLFESFADSYVSGMIRVIQAAKNSGAESLRVFLPSSEALNEPIADLFEYSVAKAAAEAAADLLSQFDPEVRVIARRLPRLPTDQTNTLMEIPSADPVETMMAICDAMSPLHNNDER